MTCIEHLEWCKARALAELEAGRSLDAFTSMLSDLNKHDGTRNHAGIQLGMTLKMAGFMEEPEQVREWIVGFRA